jgi:hypothetical protein
MLSKIVCDRKNQQSLSHSRKGNMMPLDQLTPEAKDVLRQAYDFLLHKRRERLNRQAQIECEGKLTQAIGIKSPQETPSEENGQSGEIPSLSQEAGSQ